MTSLMTLYLPHKLKINRKCKKNRNTIQPRNQSTDPCELMIQVKIKNRSKCVQIVKHVLTHNQMKTTH